MKAVQYFRYGPAADVAEVVEVPDPGAPGTGEIVIEVLASPINPSEFLNFEGRFGNSGPPLPAFAGGEAVGRVAALGEGVSHLAIGDRVLTQYAGRGSWRERIKTSAEGMFRLPDTIDPLQLAMLAVNPATAWNMLEGFVTLKPGDWVLQNAGNSSVGYNVIQLARRLGVRTVSIVRREDQIAPLLGLGADAVVVDGPDLPTRIAAAVDGAPIRLAFDAVAGASTRALVNSVAPGGTVVIYGIMSGGKSDLDATDILFRDVSLRGFWLTVWFRQTGQDEKQALYEKLASLMIEGAIDIPIEATYPMSRVKEALAHAERPGRAGKIMLTMNDAG
jgi:mitochondrial enoyl-[acyl-carrier protein] reductase / trans-2-enoyl-CoA reductase